MKYFPFRQRFEHFFDSEMEKYFESILNDMSSPRCNAPKPRRGEVDGKITGSAKDIESINIVSVFADLGLIQLKTFLEKKHIAYIDLDAIIYAELAKVTKELPNECILLIDRYIMAIERAIDTMRTMYEYPIVLIVNFNKSVEMLELCEYLVDITREKNNIKWYHINYDISLMFNEVLNKQHKHQDKNVALEFMNIFANQYFACPEGTDHAIAITVEDIERYLMNFKRWFNSETLMKAVINGFFEIIRYDLDKRGIVYHDGDTIYIHVAVRSDIFIKFLDIHRGTTEELNEVFATMDLP